MLTEHRGCHHCDEAFLASFTIGANSLMNVPASDSPVNKVNEVYDPNSGPTLVLHALGNFLCEKTNRSTTPRLIELTKQAVKQPM